jgi:transcriptional regulator NrdR
VDSRPTDDNTSIRRRRQCDECGRRFTTYEKVEIIPLTVIKKDHTRESYDRNKILAGIMRACHKRPVPVEKLEETIAGKEAESKMISREITLAGNDYEKIAQLSDDLNRVEKELETLTERWLELSDKEG